VKGLGEVTAISVAPNAVYHATGKRVRDLPITVEKISEARDGPEVRRQHSHQRSVAHLFRVAGGFRRPGQR